MATQSSIQSKVNFGYAKAASILGVANNWYRPNGITAPIVSGNLRGTPNVLYDTNADMQQTKPSDAAKPQDWYGAFDRTGMLAGDYLVDPTLGTFFICSMELFRAVRVVRCNATFSAERPAPHPPGTGFYLGDVSGQGTVLFTSWPGGITAGPKGEKSAANLPGDSRSPWYRGFLPLSAPTVQFGDVLTDAQSRRMVVSEVVFDANFQAFTAQYAGT